MQDPPFDVLPIRLVKRNSSTGLDVPLPFSTAADHHSRTVVSEDNCAWWNDPNSRNVSLFRQDAIAKRKSVASSMGLSLASLLGSVDTRFTTEHRCNFLIRRESVRMRSERSLI